MLTRNIIIIKKGIPRKYDKQGDSSYELHTTLNKVYALF